MAMRENIEVAHYGVVASLQTSSVDIKLVGDD